MVTFPARVKVRKTKNIVEIFSKELLLGPILEETFFPKRASQRHTRGAKQARA